MAFMQSTNDTESVIRKYLLFLEDPGRLRDEAEIRKAQQAVDEARDPIEKLKAIADLKQASEVDEGPLRQAFVQHARAWADEQGVPLSAFQEMRVPDDVLRDAGFDVPAARRRGRGATPSGDGGGRQRAKAVPAEEIKAHVLQQQGTFLLADIQRGIGGSPATVRKAVDELIEAGQVEKLGPAPDWQGRGRAPIQYRRT